MPAQETPENKVDASRKQDVSGQSPASGTGHDDGHTEQSDDPRAKLRLTRRRVALVAGAAIAAGVGGVVAVSRLNHAKDESKTRFFPEDEGAVGDGVADDRPAIQASMDAAASQAGTVVLAGTYGIGSSLYSRDDVTLLFRPGAKLQRAFSGGALIRNEDFVVKVKRFRVTGPGTIGALDHSYTGQTIFLYGDDLDLSEFTIATYAGGQAILIGGDSNRLTNLTIRNPEDAAGAGGIRMFGGTDFRAAACHVVAGDDAFQFTPIASSGQPLRDMSISDSAYVGCTGGSTRARFAVALLSTSPPGAKTMSASISNVSFTACQGFAQRRGIVIANTDSSGEIGEVLVECKVDMSGAVDGGGQQEILIHRASGTGRVHDLQLRRVHLKNPAATAFGTRGDATTDTFVESVVLEECTLEAPANGDATVKAYGIEGLAIRGGRIEGAGTEDVIKGGAGVNASGNVSVTGTTITGIGNGRAGMRLPETTGYMVRDCHFEPAAGATSGSGVSVGATSRNGGIIANDFTNLSGPGITGQLPAGTVVRDNLGPSRRRTGELRASVG